MAGESGGRADPAVIAALEAAVAGDEANAALRCHLADLLVAAGRHAEALGHAARVLQAQPDHPGALRIMAEATATLGGAAPAAAAAPAASVVPDTADELLGQWSETEAPSGIEIGELTRPGARLADVGGMDDVKRRLELSFLAPLRHPDIGAQFGKSLRGGLLLWGPPGCGKTFIARALAGELGANFYEVGLTDVLDMWIGNSERNLRGIFDAARRNRPCVLFFDEIDAIGQKRAALRAGGAAMRGVVNQLLAELDGASTDNEGVFVLGATNHPWDVDPALLRPGRFDRMLLVLPPDPPAREAILRLHLAGKPTEKLDLRGVVRSTDGYSGADLALICDQATERAMEASLQTGVTHPVTQADLAGAAKQVRPSVGAWLDTARNFALYANEGGTYDDLLPYLKRR
ncbi:MAG TPA: AAA family ATPase [Acidimicrobiales bacterium]|jgi:ATP-dependent 26S proteasome regulatory subunit